METNREKSKYFNNKIKNKYEFCEKSYPQRLVANKIIHSRSNEYLSKKREKTN